MLLEECGLSRQPDRTFACYLHLVAATGLLSAVPILLHWTFWGDLHVFSPVGGFLLIESEACKKSTIDFKFLQAS